MHKRPPAGALNVPAHIRWVEGRPVVWRVGDTDPDDDTGQGMFEHLKFGDAILAIDGKPVGELIEEWKPYYGGSNETSIMRDICRSMLRGDDTTVRVTVDRDGTDTELVVRRDDPLELEPVEPHFDGRIVILVDEYSMSQSEYTAMAFRAAPGAIVVGSQTAGADGNVSGIMLPGGHRTSISGIGIFYPDKSRTQKVGIVPDIEVLPTIAGVRAGRDEVLEAAAAAILGQEATAEEIRAMALIPHAPQ